jgi:hypothetical protein
MKSSVLGCQTRYDPFTESFCAPTFVLLTVPPPSSGKNNVQHFQRRRRQTMHDDSSCFFFFLTTSSHDVDDDIWYMRAILRHSLEPATSSGSNRSFPTCTNPLHTVHRPGVNTSLKSKDYHTSLVVCHRTCGLSHQTESDHCGNRDVASLL